MWNLLKYKGFHFLFFVSEVLFDTSPIDFPKSFPEESRFLEVLWVLSQKEHIH